MTLSDIGAAVVAVGLSAAYAYCLIVWGFGPVLFGV